MSRYIDADAVLSKLPEDLPYKASVKRVLIQAPTTDVVEVRHGYWVHNEDHNAYESEYFCSECLADGARDIRGEKYCYNCGAKMDGGRDEK